MRLIVILMLLLGNLAHGDGSPPALAPSDFRVVVKGSERFVSIGQPRSVVVEMLGQPERVAIESDTLYPNLRYEVMIYSGCSVGFIQGGPDEVERIVVRSERFTLRDGVTVGSAESHVTSKFGEPTARARDRDTGVDVMAYVIEDPGNASNPQRAFTSRWRSMRLFVQDGKVSGIVIQRV